MGNKTFHTLGLNDTMIMITEELYFKEPTEIQQQAIPKILQGKSIVGESETGSGKTHAYLLPLFNKLKKQQDGVQVVIIAPTRELAIQIHEEIKVMRELANKGTEWDSMLIIGGLDRQRMKQKLTRQPTIVVGTPGRVLDMVDKGVLSIYSATSFVIDEADLMVEMNFMEDVDKLLVRCKNNIQIVVFSATIPKQIRLFLMKYIQQPVHISIESGATPESITHRLVKRREQHVAKTLLEIIASIQPYVAILFTNSKESADELGHYLRQESINVAVLHGGLSSRERRRIVKAILNHEYQYIVATDLASRGIDIKGASHVINVQLPKEIDFYIHRVGRTARAGLAGMAISFYSDEDIGLIEKLEKEGVTFTFSDFKDNEWVEVSRFDRRSRRKDQQSELDKEAWQRVRKRRTVKPGYKKKMKWEQEQIKRKLQRKRRRKKRK